MTSKRTYSHSSSNHVLYGSSSSNLLGFWSAVATTASGILYFVIILAAIVLGQFTFPPPEWLQLTAGIISLIACPLIVVMMVSLYFVIPADKKVFSLAALAFTVLFAMSVSINRYSQLGVVRQGLDSGNTEGISWFLAYGDFSIMLGMEFMGWAWFLGLAMLCAAPIFTQGRFEKWLRGFMLLYAALGLVAAIAFLVASPLTMLGFVAWGIVLFIITWMLAVYFKRQASFSS
jgi:hypothetical protein